MLERDPTILFAAILGAVLLLASGCLTTIDDACSSAASTQCSNCFACGADVDGISGTELCDIDVEDGDSQSDCEDVLEEQCANVARSLEEPFDELEDCEIAVEEDTCDELIEREALDRRASPGECRRFL